LKKVYLRVADLSKLNLSTQGRDLDLELHPPTQLLAVADAVAVLAVPEAAVDFFLNI
jgi:hypothetical protein